jgi:hypothetical protein
MATEEFTPAEARAKLGQLVRSRGSIPWPEGVIGQVVEVRCGQAPAGHPPDRAVFTIAWQRFPHYDAVPRTAMPLSKRQYEDTFQELWLDDAQYRLLFGG